MLSSLYSHDGLTLFLYLHQGLHQAVICPMGHLHNIIGLEKRTERDTLVIVLTIQRGWSLQ